MMRTLQLLALLFSLAKASDVFPTEAGSHLNFIVPQHIYRNGTGYEHSIARFGSKWSIHGMEGQMINRVYYGNHSFCEPVPHNPEWIPPYFLLINRGVCDFVTKVRHAQLQGAAGVIFKDEKGLTDLDPLWDDGSGSDISIPSMMIKHEDGVTIRETLLKEGQPVVAEMAWHWPKHDDWAMIGLWYSPNDVHAAKFLTNFSKIANALEGHLVFIPHYFLLDGTKLNCGGNADHPENSCYNLCTNNGRYCHPGSGQVTGKQVVVESLRRICIREHFGLDLWWKYVAHFNEWCTKTDEYFADDKCLADAYKHAGINQGMVEECMKDSGDVNSDTPNAHLTTTVDEVHKYGIYQTPSVLVNNMPLRWGPISPKNVFDVYCTSFEYGMAPHACYMCAACGDPVACVSRKPMKCLASDGEEKESPAKKAKKKHHHTFLKWFFALGLIGGAGFVYYKKFVENGEDGGGRYTLADAFLSDSPITGRV